MVQAITYLAKGILIDKEYYDPDDVYDTDFMAKIIKTSKFTFIVSQILKHECLDVNYKKPEGWIMLEESVEKANILALMESAYKDIPEEMEGNSDDIKGAVDALQRLQDWIELEDFHEGLFAILIYS